MMAIYIVVKSGPSQGESYELSDGLLIGRRAAGIRLNDAKISSEHAKIVQNEDGTFEVQDLGSKNGILNDGERVESIVLNPGTEFEIGPFRLAVFELNPAQKKKPEKKPKRKWNEVLTSFLRKTTFRVENNPKTLEPMRPALVLDFLKGPQAETRWVLGYGPRRIGRSSIDLPVFEEKASDFCFEVFPSEEGIGFKALGKEVRLNGKSVSTEILRVGDRIQIFGTEMEVDFIE